MAVRYETGLHSKSAESIAIGGASVYIGFDATKFVPGDKTTRGICIGATKGGSQISVTPTYHQSEVDGAITKVLGMAWMTESDVKLETSILEVTEGNLEMALGTFENINHNADYNMIQHGSSLEERYVGDVAVFTNIKGREYPVVYVIRDAVITSGLEYDTNTGKDDVAVKLTFEGRVDPAKDIYKIPFYILYPKASTSPTAAPTANLQAGTYEDDQTVALTAQNGALIYYTTDGSIPTPTNGSLYVGPIAITSTTTVKAVAVFNSRVSTVLELEYVIEKP